MDSTQNLLTEWTLPRISSAMYMGPLKPELCVNHLANQSANAVLWSLLSVCAPVRCWPGLVPRSTASSMPVKAEWPCQPRATNRMFRLRATQCSFQAGVSRSRNLCSVINNNNSAIIISAALLINSKLVLFHQESGGNVCSTHHPRYYSVICVWILGRAKPVWV